MYLKTPMMFGRPMRLVKKYPRFVLYEDVKTGVRQSYQYWDLMHEVKYLDGKEQVFMYDHKGNLVPVDMTKEAYLPYDPNRQPRKVHKVMSDKRVDNLIKNMFSDLV